MPGRRSDPAGIPAFPEQRSVFSAGGPYVPGQTDRNGKGALVRKTAARSGGGVPDFGGSVPTYCADCHMACKSQSALPLRVVFRMT